MKSSCCGLLIIMALAASGRADDPDSPQPLRLGEQVTVKGRTLFVEKIENGKVLLAPPAPPTACLGAFITPVEATASDSQSSAGRTPRKMIDGSGWGESFPGSGRYVHTASVYADGNCMWNGKWNAWLLFDLGKTYQVNGMYVWNYNEGQGWNTRGVKDLDVLASLDGQEFSRVGSFTLTLATGQDDYQGEAVPFKAAVKARYLKFQIKSNYRGGEMSGLAEVRFSNAEEKAPLPQRPQWKPKYLRPAHPTLKLGEPLPGAENIVYPDDAGVVDVSKPPYGAKGDGVSNDTAAIQCSAQ